MWSNIVFSLGMFDNLLCYTDPWTHTQKYELFEAIETEIKRNVLYFKNKEIIKNFRPGVEPGVTAQKVQFPYRLDWLVP